MKFIKLTIYHSDESCLVNVNKIREVVNDEVRSLSEVYFSDAEYILVKEKFEEIEKLLNA